MLDDATGLRAAGFVATEIWQSGSSMLSKSGVQTTSSLDDLGRLAGGFWGLGDFLTEVIELVWLRLDAFDSTLSIESERPLAFALANRQQVLLSFFISRRISASDRGIDCRPLPEKEK